MSSTRAAVVGLLVSALVSALDAPAFAQAPAAATLPVAPALASAPDPERAPDRVVRWRRTARDLAREARSFVTELADATTAQLPDLTVLRVQPVVLSDSTRASSGFGWREDPFRRRKKFHHGADIRARPGTPVLSAGDGVVVFAGRRGGYGKVIDIDHGGGVITRYAHLRRIEVKADAAIRAGERIGQVGSTGRATGPHLHFEVRLDGRAVNPGTALAVAEIWRESPLVGRVAALALAPELQARAVSPLDPPRVRKARAKARGKAIERDDPGPRPDRPGRVKRPRPIS